MVGPTPFDDAGLPMTLPIKSVLEFLQGFAPLELAEDWDNVGMLVGRGDGNVTRILTCLTITPEVVDEAISSGVDLIVSHHPMPFRPLKTVTDGTIVGRMTLSLIENRIAVYSPHTAFDSATSGINKQLAQGLGLSNVKPLLDADVANGGEAAGEVGSGRFGVLSAGETLATTGERLKQFLGIDALRVVGSLDQEVTRAAVACGAAGQFLEPASEAGCDLLITGETNFHTCLEARARNVALILTGHYASERFAVVALADVLAAQFGDIQVTASSADQNPWQML